MPTDKLAKYIDTAALCIGAKSLCIVALWSLGLLIYSRSLFFEKSPIKEHNVVKSSCIYKKGVILVMDGVRADAIHTVAKQKQTKYHNNFTALDIIPKEDVFKAVCIADLPTGTAMRILSIFSGIPTTLLSAQRSFKSQSCGVDNFIAQLQSENFSFIFYGDETWTYLFPEIKPNIGETYHPYGLVPFNEEKRLIKCALDAQSSHDLVIIHLISPDSYGHVHETDSTEVQTALQIINDFLLSLHSSLTDESFIAVLSDHGVNNDGSHGGTSLLEKAASFLFIAKRVNLASSNDLGQDKPSNLSGASSTMDVPPDSAFSSHLHSNGTQTYCKKETAAKENNSLYMKYSNHEAYKKYKDKIKQLHITEPVNIISQNDILPTLCVFLGLPVPYNSSGSLISQLLSADKHANIYEQEISRQKASLAYLQNAKSFENTASATSNNDIVKTNELLGNQIHSMFHTSSILGMGIGAAIICAGILLHLAIFKIQIISMLLAVSGFAIFMVAHSVHSIIHEDIISLCACVWLGFPLDTLWVGVLLPAMTLLSGQFPLHSVDRHYFILWIKKLPARFTVPFLENSLFACSIACFMGYHLSFAFSKTNFSQLKSCALVLFACSQFFSSGAPRLSRSSVLCASFNVLPLLLYTPVSALMFLYVFCPIVKKSVSSIVHPNQKGCFLFFLIKIMFFATGHNHALSSINWEAAFLFSKKRIPVLSAVLVASDLLLPFAYIAYILAENNMQSLHIIVLLQSVCAFLGYIINFWFLGQSLMWFIFAGRTIFESFFLIMFALFQTILCVRAPASFKMPFADFLVSIGCSGSTLEAKHKRFIK